MRETNRRRIRWSVQQRDVTRFLDEARFRHRRELGENARSALLVPESNANLDELVVGKRLVELLAQRVSDAAGAHVDDRCQGMTEDAQVIGLLFGKMHPFFVVRAALAGAVGRG